ncbi:hypothetical protein MKX01_017355 [Papaver californicum]|nr:hypothetical protein MKX01_017355 [Papaver californicum]
MYQYQRVDKPRTDTPISENEIQITTQGRMRNYITYATSLLQEKCSNKIVFKAMGRAINKTIMIVELIKITSIGSTDIIDTWEPLEEDGSPRASGRGRGPRGGRGRGRGGRGNGLVPGDDYGEGGGWDRGRGFPRGGWGCRRGRAFRGRGRGGYNCPRKETEQDVKGYNNDVP